MKIKHYKNTIRNRIDTCSIRTHIELTARNKMTTTLTTDDPLEVKETVYILVGQESVFYITLDQKTATLLPTSRVRGGGGGLGGVVGNILTSQP